MVKDIVVGGSSQASPIAALGELLLFRARDATHGEELWVTDGTPTGTKLLKDITSGNAGTFIFDPVVLDGTAYFLALPDTSKAHELWKSDGTPAGTVRVKRLPGRPWGARARPRVGDALVFVVNVPNSATDPMSGHRLWTSDGTTSWHPPGLARPSGSTPTS